MNNTFIYQDTKLPAFLQFPEFLLRVPISQTAKLLYLVLYNRSRLSMLNGWIDELGRVYVVFPISELAKRLGKSETTVKTGLKELCEADLLMKCFGGFSRPNHLYIKYASESQFSERVEEKPVIEAENHLSNSQFSDLQTVEDPAPNKVMNESNSMNSNGVMEPTPRGRYRNIFLSDEEMSELQSEFASNASRYIEELSEYVASTGKTYRNHAATIRRWAANDNKKVAMMENYECNEEDSF